MIDQAGTFVLVGGENPAAHRSAESGAFSGRRPGRGRGRTNRPEDKQ